MLAIKNIILCILQYMYIVINTNKYNDTIKNNLH